MWEGFEVSGTKPDFGRAVLYQSIYQWIGCGLVPQCSPPFSKGSRLPRVFFLELEPDSVNCPVK